MKFKLGLCQIAGSVDKEIAKQNAEKHVRQAAENGEGGVWLIGFSIGQKRAR